MEIYAREEASFRTVELQSARVSSRAVEQLLTPTFPQHTFKWPRFLRLSEFTLCPLQSTCPLKYSDLNDKTKASKWKRCCFESGAPSPPRDHSRQSAITADGNSAVSAGWRGSPELQKKPVPLGPAVDGIPSPAAPSLVGLYLQSRRVAYDFFYRT